MRVLVACEFSGIVREAFRKKGHEAWSCDYLPSEHEYKGPHLEGNCLSWAYDGSWDLMIAHPPCTYFANSGVRWLKTGDYSKTIPRWEELYKAAGFFKLLLDAPVKRICIENPIPHKYAIELIGKKYDQIIHPWQFGHGETKATCLWLKGLPELKPTEIVEGREARIHKMPPSKDRSKLRSITYQGIADAMADQWGAGL